MARTTARRAWRASVASEGRSRRRRRHRTPALAKSLVRHRGVNPTQKNSDRPGRPGIPGVALRFPFAALPVSPPAASFNLSACGKTLLSLQLASRCQSHPMTGLLTDVSRQKHSRFELPTSGGDIRKSVVSLARPVQKRCVLTGRISSAELHWACDRYSPPPNHRVTRQASSPGFLALRIDGGGHRWAVVCSLADTCKLNGVEPLRLFA